MNPKLKIILGLLIIFPTTFILVSLSTFLLFFIFPTTLIVGKVIITLTIISLLMGGQLLFFSGLAGIKKPKHHTDKPKCPRCKSEEHLIRTFADGPGTYKCEKCVWHFTFHELKG